MPAANWDRVKQIFQDALERPPADRARYVREHCGADRELLAEVESLLATHQDAGSFAARPAEELLDGLVAGPTGAGHTSPGPGVRPGDRLGVYEIESLIGVGGMGEVYKARDTRLERTVALKVLPTHLAANRDRYQRFEREARAVASLDHPHIGALYDVGQHDGLHFLVMQLLDGETLATRLTKGALPLDQVLRYAIDLADALDHAHRRGIVHRDVKPGNIVLTKAGATLLDFGLAKWRAVATGVTGDLTAAATGLDRLTEKGAIVGTLHYMAPEQVEGKETDTRADLFAFGSVVYEMITGRNAFDGGSPAGVLAAILNSSPSPIPTLRPLTPQALDHVVRTCLAKDPDERWQSAGDIARQLRWIAESANTSSMVASTVWLGNRRTIMIAAAIGVLASGFLGAEAWIRMQTRPAVSPLQVTRTIVSLPAGTSLGFSPSPVAVSPDGTHLAYVAARGDGSRMYLHALDQFEAKAIAGTEGASEPFFSPDSRWLGFSTPGKLKKVAVSGGAPQTICDATAVGATWGSDDTIIFATGFRTGLSKCAASGGAPQVLTTPDKGKREKSHRWPQFLPGGRAVLFNIIPADIGPYEDARIAVLSLDTGQIRIVLDGGTHARFVRTGNLLYIRGGSLVAVPFDPRRLEITGESMPVLDGVSTLAQDGEAYFSVSENGLLAYLRGDARGSDRRVVWVDRLGRVEPVMDAHRPFFDLKLAPDGQRLALTISAANDQVWVYHLARRTLTPLTLAWDNAIDSWTPDGRRVVFRSVEAGQWNFYSQLADGSGLVERLTESSNVQGGGSWSPDGRVFAFHERALLSGPQNLRLLDVVSGRSTALRLTQSLFSEQEPTFSPDGRWLAYVSTESGRPEVFVQPYPGLGAKWRISTDGGTGPLWDRLGRELFYRNGGKVMAVAIQIHTTFVPGTPRLLFEGDYLAESWKNYDVGPDGRFIMIQADRNDVPQTQITLVQNWFEELKQRVPTRNSAAK